MTDEDDLPPRGPCIVGDCDEPGTAVMRLDSIVAGPIREEWFCEKHAREFAGTWERDEATPPPRPMPGQIQMELS